MKRTHLLALAAAALLLVWGLMAGHRGCADTQVHQGETQAATAQGESNVHMQQANELQAKAQAEREARKTAEANVGRLKKENAELLRRLAAGPGAGVPHDPGSSSAQPGHADPDLRDAVIEKQQEIIAEQDKVIESQGAELTLVHRENTELRAAMDAQERRAVGLQIALDAQKHVRSSERWSGRVEGASAGTVFGFLLKVIL